MVILKSVTNTLAQVQLVKLEVTRLASSMTYTCRIITPKGVVEGVQDLSNRLKRTSI